MTKEFASTRKWSFTDVFFWSLMVGIGETYIGAFALAYGFSERYAGLISVIPLGIASIGQLFSSWIFHYFKSRKHYVTTFACLQALCLFALVLRPENKTGYEERLLMILTGYWFFGLSAGPVWNAWIVSIIPEQYRLNFFSIRGRFQEVALLFGLVIGGILLHLSNGSLTTFSILFFLAGTSRLVSAFSLSKHASDKNQPFYKEHMDWSGFKKWIVKKDVIGILCFLGLFHFGVSLASPYFTPFIIKKMNLSYEWYMLTLSVPFISRALSYRFSEKLVQRFGIQNLLFSSALVVALSPMIWAHYPVLYILLILQFVSGWTWANFEYCVLLRQISDFSNDERSRVLTWSNLLVGIANILGVLISSSLLGAEPTQDSYSTIFNLSTLFRLLPLAIIFVIDWKSARRGAKKFYLRYVGARVGRGLLIRPIFFPDKKQKGNKN